MKASKATFEEVLEAIRTGEVQQIEIASRAGLSPATVSMIVTGATQNPAYSTAMSMAAALDAWRAEQEIRQ